MSDQPPARSGQPSAGPAGFELGTDGPTAILVGFDGSDSSWRALHYAIGLARRQASRVVAVYVSHTPAIAYAAPAVPAIAGLRCGFPPDLASAVEALGREHSVGVTLVAASGDPVSAITAAAADHRVDLIVVGASTKAGHRVFGSTALRAVRARCCPVTVVP
jgi:nucleotide-binding universal stress UspA family protein